LHTSDPDVTVTDPTYAYDQNLTTYAHFLYSGVDAYPAFELHTFDISEANTSQPIIRVDIKMKYSTTISSKDDMYRIGIYVGGYGPTVLKDFTRDNTPLDVYNWTNVADPSPGGWSWADIADLKITVDVEKTGGPDSGGDFYEYEAWVIVISGAAALPHVFVAGADPSGNITDYTLTPQPKTILRPDGDGTFWDWIGTPTDSYLDWAEEAQDGDSSYFYTDMEDMSRSSTLQNLGAVTYSIAKVRVVIFARSNVTTDDMVAPTLVIGGIEFEGKAQSVTTTYSEYTSEWGKNPDTGDFWTWEDIDGLEAGVISLMGPDMEWDTGMEIRVTQLYVEVYFTRLTVEIWVDNVMDLWGWQFELSFNPDVIQGVEVQPGLPVELGPFLGSEGGAVGQLPGPGWNNTIGKLWLTGAYLLVTRDTTIAPDGAGRLAMVHFLVVGQGETDIRLDEMTGLKDPWGEWIIQGRDYVEDGYFRNIDLTLMPTASFTVNPAPEGFNTTLDGTSSSPAPGRTIVTFKWYIWSAFRSDLDTLIISETIVDHVFMRGTWPVTLTVIDDVGAVGTTTVYVTIPAHDVAIFSIETNATMARYPMVLYADIGEMLEVNVTVVNEGDFNETGLTVEAYWKVFYAGQYQYGSIGPPIVIDLATGQNTTLTFYWNTEGRNITHPDTYTILANVTTVPYEYDTADNERESLGHRIRFHDIAITSVATNVTDTITPGDIVEITVTVVNEGDFNETDLTVTVYYDNTIIDTQLIDYMENRTYGDYPRPKTWEKTLTFIWDTSGVPGQTYTIKATVTVVQDDYDPNDNTYIDGEVTVVAVVPEFPLGGALMIAAAIAIIYIWWKRRHGATSKTSISARLKRKPSNIALTI
jgi:hypothetical protein